jgi:hypothetical protein
MKRPTPKLKLNRQMLKNTKLLIIWLVIILLILVAVSFKTAGGNYFISSECSLANISYGTDKLALNISQSGNYIIWLQIEAPQQISFNILPGGGDYNPLFIGVDNKTCYQAGGSYIQPNTWTWINYENANKSKLLSVYLSKGMHTISLVASNLSVDRVEVLKPGSSPAL